MDSSPELRSTSTRPSGRRVHWLVPAALTVASVLLLAATWVPGRASEWIYVLLPPLFPVLLILLALATRSGLPRLLLGLVVALGMLLVGAAVAIRLLDARPATSWWLGLPVSAVVLGLGLVVLPLLLVGFGFAATYDLAAVGEDRSTRRGADDEVGER